jgi:hypothetical protein
MASTSFEQDAERHARKIGNVTNTQVNNWYHPGPAAFDFRSKQISMARKISQSSKTNHHLQATQSPPQLPTCSPP